MSSRAKCRLVLAVLLIPIGFGSAAAQEPQGKIWVHISAPEASLEDLPVMVSFARDGALVFQMEVPLEAPPHKATANSDFQPPGLYDVRVEGEGLVTEIKRGIHIFEDGRAGRLHFNVVPGEGVHIVEYATGPLSREELAARLAALEAAVAEISDLIPEKLER